MAHKIVYEKKECIGAGECEALAPHLWKVDNKGKADLAKAELNPKTGKYEVTIGDGEFKLQKDVADSCPTGCIKIEEA